MFGGFFHADEGKLNKMCYIEYLLTCPWMMLIFVVLGGPKVRGQVYRPAVVFVTQLVLVEGFVASWSTNGLIEIANFLMGLSLFLLLIWIVNLVVKEHSDGAENLFSDAGSSYPSPYKALGQKIIATWILFPIWWLASPDGLALVTDSERVNAFVKVFLNTFAKGMYIVYMRILQIKYKNKSDLEHQDAMPNEVLHQNAQMKYEDKTDLEGHDAMPKENFHQNGKGGSLAVLEPRPSHGLNLSSPHQQLDWQRKLDRQTRDIERLQCRLEKMQRQLEDRQVGEEEGLVAITWWRSWFSRAHGYLPVPTQQANSATLL
jgi:bacteriorhodopsin